MPLSCNWWFDDLFTFANIECLIMQAMKVVSDRQTLEATAKKLKETELSRVKINKEDIDLIVSRMQ
jgi:NACalpha-BTF3-like transcription factor